jgi:hypothetical protein
MPVVDTTRTFTNNEQITSTKLNEIMDNSSFVSGAVVTSGGLEITAGGQMQIESNGVTTAKIADANVTTSKIADANVTTAKIADANVTTAKIADSNVTQAKLAANVVGNGPLFRAYKNATQSISTATDTIVSFQVEQHDTNNNFSSNQFTPSIEGYYMLTASVGLTLAADELSVQIQKNGAAYDFSERSSVPSYRTRLTTLMYMNGSTDSARVIARQLEGVSRTIDDDPAVTSFSGCLVRSA